ncbi:MAG: hypothetical protein SNJ55_09805 [Chloroherpetonaceae bacterium]
MMPFLTDIGDFERILRVVSGRGFFGYRRLTTSGGLTLMKKMSSLGQNWYVVGGF